MKKVNHLPTLLFTCNLRTISNWNLSCDMMGDPMQACQSSFHNMEGTSFKFLSFALKSESVFSHLLRNLYKLAVVEGLSFPFSLRGWWGQQRNGIVPCGTCEKSTKKWHVPCGTCALLATPIQSICGEEEEVEEEEDSRDLEKSLAV